MRMKADGNHLRLCKSRDDDDLKYANLWQFITTHQPISPWVDTPRNQTSVQDWIEPAWEFSFSNRCLLRSCLRSLFFFSLSLATSSGSGKNVTGRQGGDAGGHVHGGGGLVYWLGVFPGCSKWVMLPPDRPFAIGQTSTRNNYYPDVEDMLLSGLHVITWCFCFSFKLVPWSWELPL